jgi:hypothetical protein
MFRETRILEWVQDGFKEGQASTFCEGESAPSWTGKVGTSRPDALTKCKRTSFSEKLG